MLAPRLKSGFWTMAFFFGLLCLSIQHGNPAYHLMALTALLIHELSHVFCCQLLGYPVRQFNFNPFGGCLKIEPSWIMNPEAESVIAAAGPMANLLMIGGVLYLRLLGISNIYLTYWLQLNLLIGTVNLIPAIPLDGGRILHAWFNKKLGLKKAYAVIRNLTIAVGILFVILGSTRLYHQKTGLFFLLIGIFIIFQSFYFKQPELNLILRQLQYKKKRLTARGFLRIRPVLTGRGTLVRTLLQYHGSNEYLLFFIQDKDQKMSIISEEIAWKSLINQGYDVTFDMIPNSSTSNMPLKSPAMDSP